MMTMRKLFVLATLSLMASGCQIWIGGGDDDCEYYPGPSTPGGVELRDPYTGQCSWTGGGTGGGTWICDDDYGYGYGDVAAEAEPDVDRAPLQDWGLCFSECTGLDERSCQATPGCRAAYVGNCPEGAMCPDVIYNYVDCWDIAPSGPSFEACEGLDAYSCSRNDNCIAHHYPASGGVPEPQPAPLPPGSGGADTRWYQPVGNFSFCGSELFPEPQGCYSDAECGPGSECNADVICLPPPGCAPGSGMDCPAVCYGFCVPAEPQGCYSDAECQPGFECNADVICLPPPGCDPMNGPCDSVCYGYCEPARPAGDCFSEVFCDAEPPACPPDSVAGRSNGCWTGECIPVSQCEMNNPGTCYGDVFCDSLPPQCPENMVPGILNGCWSGACIPLGQCEQPASCADAASEDACIARAECTPVYEGVQCTCDAAGNCTCSDWSFSYCTDECLMDDPGFCVMGSQGQGQTPNQP